MITIWRKILVKNLSLAMLITGIGTVQAKTVYIAPTGTTANNNSTYNNPIGFDKLLSSSGSMPTSLVSSGDTVFFKGGQYDVTKIYTFIQTGSNGTASKRTFLGSYPGETAVFDGRTLPYGNEGGSDNIALKVPANYVHIKGIVVQYAGKNGLHITGSNNIIENCTAYSNSDTGIQLKSGGNNTIKNCDSFRNFDYKTKSGSDPDYGGNADGFADKQYTSPSGTKNTYIGCRSWENSDDGWDFFQHVSATGYPTEIRESWCFRNGPAQFDMTGHARYETDKAYFEQFKSGDKIVITNYGNGNGFKVGGDATKHNVIVSNCVAFNNKVKGFDQNNNGGDMVFYNCTGYANKPNYGLNNTGKGATLTVKNCITAKGLSSDAFLSTYAHSNNTWDLSPKITVTDADFASVDTTSATSARNTDGSLPGMNGLFRLSSSSQCIDKGTNVGLPYNGSAPDLGAFEYNPDTRIKFTSVEETSFYAYPNPVKTSTRFSLQVQETDRIVIEIFDMTGKKVAIACDRQMEAGHHEISFERGNLPAGVYLYRLTCNRMQTGRHLIIN